MTTWTVVLAIIIYNSYEDPWLWYVFPGRPTFSDEIDFNLAPQANF